MSQEIGKLLSSCVEDLATGLIIKMSSMGRKFEFALRMIVVNQTKWRRRKNVTNLKRANLTTDMYISCNVSHKYYTMSGAKQICLQTRVRRNRHPLCRHRAGTLFFCRRILQLWHLFRHFPPFIRCFSRYKTFSKTRVLCDWSKICSHAFMRGK